MKYRRLGRTGLQVSVIGVGTWRLGGEWGKQFTQPEVDILPGAWVTAGDDWRSGHDPAEARRKLELVEEVRRTEAPQGVAMAAWAIGWCLRHPAVGCVVAGCRSVQQLEANAAAADLDLVRDDHPQSVATR